MVNSMTGFAAQTGQALGYSWSIDIRSVNGKGLDLRFRVPDWVDGLEQGLRGHLSKRLSRGSVNINIRVVRDEMEYPLRIDAEHLNRVLDGMAEISAVASQKGFALAHPTSADILGIKGVLDAGSPQDEDTKPLAKALMAAVDEVLGAFSEMRTAEGAALDGVLRNQLAEVARLVAAAQDAAAQRSIDSKAAMTAALTRVVDNVDGIDEARVAQELAMIAVKADITEELDRLVAHVDAARALLDADVAIGRKLDFLCQEFNREANTLCSKAQSTVLTGIGLDLKALIDQMREQVQNVE
jgi:uncharacterized protein (TIGR00255 family)